MVEFEMKVGVFTEDGTRCGDIEPKPLKGKAWSFTPCDEVPIAADELRAIADKLDELNKGDA